MTAITLFTSSLVLPPVSHPTFSVWDLTYLKNHHELQFHRMILRDIQGLDAKQRNLPRPDLSIIRGDPTRRRTLPIFKNKLSPSSS